MKKTLLLFITFLVATLSIGCTKKTEQASTAPTLSTIETTKTASEVTPQERASILHPLPANLSGKEALNQIKAQHKGKVVLIDFWATWCPPCLAAMEAIKEIKPELKKKGVVFVYITGETSSEGDFQRMMPTIVGEHYRLTDKQWAEIGQLLGMRGIPAFMLLDKKGKVTFNNIAEGGYPGNEVIKNQIEIALTK